MPSAFVAALLGLTLALSDVASALPALGALIFGAATTFLVTHVYYVAAGQDLAAEAQELQRLSALTLRALQTAGIATVRWDDHGRPVDVVLEIRGTAQGTSSATAALMPLAPATSPRPRWRFWARWR